MKKKYNIRKLANIFAFYTSTLAINSAVSTAALAFGGFSYFTIVFLTLGFALSIAVKEVRNPNEYLFYINNGMSKLQLWVYSFLLNFITGFFIACIVIVINAVW